MLQPMKVEILNRVGALTRQARHLLFAIVGVIASISGASATSVVIQNLGRYDGITCDKLMDVYKRAYTSVGFTLDGIENVQPGFYKMTFSFPNPSEPKKPAGGGWFEFLAPRTKAFACSAFMPAMGAPSDSGAYSPEEFWAFFKVVNAADRKAQALITKELGAPKPE